MKELKQKRKEHILDAAFQVFIESGYTHAKMSDIAARAGYGKSTLYEYFKGKDEIFEQLLQYKAVDAYYAIGASAELENCASAKIRSFISQEIDLYLVYNRYNDIVPMILTTPEFMSNPVLFEAVRFVFRYRFENIARWIGEGLASGEFSGADRNVAATAIMGAATTLGTALAQARFLPAGEDANVGKSAGVGIAANTGASANSGAARRVCGTCAKEDMFMDVEAFLREGLPDKYGDALEHAKEALFRFIFAGLGMDAAAEMEQNSER